MCVEFDVCDCWWCVVEIYDLQKCVEYELFCSCVVVCWCIDECEFCVGCDCDGLWWFLDIVFDVDLQCDFWWEGVGVEQCQCVGGWGRQIGVVVFDVLVFVVVVGYDLVGGVYGNGYCGEGQCGEQVCVVQVERI